MIKNSDLFCLMVSEVSGHCPFTSFLWSFGKSEHEVGKQDNGLKKSCLCRDMEEPEKEKRVYDKI